MKLAKNNSKKSNLMGVLISVFLFSWSCSSNESGRLNSPSKNLESYGFPLNEEIETSFTINRTLNGRNSSDGPIRAIVTLSEDQFVSYVPELNFTGEGNIIEWNGENFTHYYTDQGKGLVYYCNVSKKLLECFHERDTPDYKANYKWEIKQSSGK